MVFDSTRENSNHETIRTIELDESTRSTHKELSKVRVQRDENDIKKVIQVHTLKTVMSNPFYEDAYSEDIPLWRLATGVTYWCRMSRSSKDEGFF